MDINNLVVARYLDGRVLKGATRDFSANRASFHVEVDGSSEIVELRARQLKALFFVKSLTGNSSRQDLRGFVDGPAETQQGRKIAVRFRDNEFLCGYTLSWSPDREGFFLFPADPGSNNQRIYVIVAATNEVKAGPAAEALAERMLGDDKAREARGPASGSLARPSSVVPRPSIAMPRPSGVSPRPSGLTPRPSGLIPRPASEPPKRDENAA